MVNVGDGAGGSADLDRNGRRKKEAQRAPHYCRAGTRSARIMRRSQGRVRLVTATLLLGIRSLPPQSPGASPKHPPRKTVDKKSALSILSQLRTNDRAECAKSIPRISA